MIMNTRFANIYSYHKEELYSCFANHDTDLHHTEIDSLLLMLDAMQHVLDDSKSAAVERYYRMYSGECRRPLLVWSLWGKAFNRLGQVYKARISPVICNTHRVRWADAPMAADGQASGSVTLV